MAAETEAGVVLGTVGYMSPEQVRGRAVDHRTDIFSFGVILYEMLAGRRAFQHGSALETMHAIVHLEMPDTGDMTPRVPGPLLGILRRCLAKDADGRFQSASDLAFALSSLSQSQVGTGVSSAIVKTRARRGGLAAAVASAFVAAALGATGYSMTMSRRPPAFPSFLATDIPSRLRVRRRALRSGRADGHLRRSVGRKAAAVVLDAGRHGRVSGVASARGGHPVGVKIRRAGDLEESSGRHAGGRAAWRQRAARRRQNVMAADWCCMAGCWRRFAVKETVERCSSTRSGPSFSGPMKAACFRIRVCPQTVNWWRCLKWTSAATGAASRSWTGGLVKQRSRRVNIAAGLAWTPEGREVWFNASETGLNFSVHAMARDGGERVIHRSMGTAAISDITRDGRALMLHERVRAGMTVVGPDGVTERDLSWLDFSRPNESR